MLGAFLGAGSTAQLVARIARVLTIELGHDHALASRRLVTDGATIIVTSAAEGSANGERRSGMTELIHTVDGQPSFVSGVLRELERIGYSRDGAVAAPTSTAPEPMYRPSWRWWA